MRVVPGIAAGGHAAIPTGTEDQKFGLPITDGSAQHAIAQLNIGGGHAIAYRYAAPRPRPPWSPWWAGTARRATSWRRRSPCRATCTLATSSRSPRRARTTCPWLRYNLVGRPPVVAVRDGSARLLVRRKASGDRHGCPAA